MTLKDVQNFDVYMANAESQLNAIMAEGRVLRAKLVAQEVEIQKKLMAVNKTLEDLKGFQQKLTFVANNITPSLIELLNLELP